MVQPKAGQYTCMYRTGAISFKFLDAISQRENKTEDSDSKNSKKNKTAYNEIFTEQTI